MAKRYYFSGRFTTSACASIEVDEDLTEEEIQEYLTVGVYDLEWDYGHKGEITSVQFDEVEEV